MRLSLLALLSIVALPAAALAQTQGTGTVITATRTTIGATDCTNNNPIIFNITVLDTNGAPIIAFTNPALWKVWVSPAGNCSETTPTGQQLLSDTDLVDVTSASTGVFTTAITPQQIVGALQQTGVDSCGGTSGINQVAEICFAYSTTLILSSPKAIAVNTQPIGPPTIDSTDGADSKVQLHVTSPADATATGWRAFFREALCPGGGNGGSGGSGGAGGAGGAGGSAITGAEICGNGIDDDGNGLVDCNDPACAGALRTTGDPVDLSTFTQFGTDFGAIFTLDVTGLTNEVTYQFVVEALRDQDVSPPSNVATGTPRATLDFWGQYKAAGGAQEGGCSSADGGRALLGAGLLAALILLTRRGRSR